MRWTAVGCLLTCLAALAACSMPVDAPAPPYPPDFALVFHVDGPADAADPLRRPAQHVVEPSRKLRVMLGPGATVADYPPPTARLSPTQMADLYRLARAAVLDDPAPPAGATASTIYRVTLTAGGRTTTRALDAEAKPAPAATALLRELVQLRGGR